MPGFHAIKLGASATTTKKDKEPIYGFIKNKKGKSRDHPLFEDLKKNQVRDKAEFIRMMKQREIMRDPNGFDSLRLLGSTNDSCYLDSFMSMPRRRVSMGELPYPRGGAKPISKSPSSVFSKGSQGSNKGSNLHSASDSNLALAMIQSLRNSGSEESVYDSVEMIHYRKTLDMLNRQKKTRSVQKTGHPLFDHLRVEQALKEDDSPKKRNARKYESTVGKGYRMDYNNSSAGNSPSASSSSSGDEYDLYPKIQPKSNKALQEPKRHYSTRPLPKEPTKGSQSPQGGQEDPKTHRMKSSKSEQILHESDDEWAIPRPRLFKLGGFSRRRGADAPFSTSDESDSSTKSTGLR